MAQDYSHELGFLRRIFRGMDKRSISFTQVNQQYLRNERLARSHPVEDGVFVYGVTYCAALEAEACRGYSRHLLHSYAARLFKIAPTMRLQGSGEPSKTHMNSGEAMFFSRQGRQKYLGSQYA